VISGGMPIAVEVRYKQLLCDSSLVEIVGSNPAGARLCVSCEYCMCCLTTVSVMGRSLFERSPTECDMSVCYTEISMISRLGPTRTVEP
jgi:hypothetical protein